LEREEENRWEQPLHGLFCFSGKKEKEKEGEGIRTREVQRRGRGKVFGKERGGERVAVLHAWPGKEEGKRASAGPCSGIEMGRS